MRSPHSFIVRPKDGKLYDNEHDGIILSSSIEDHEFTNRMAIVEEIPVGYSGPIENGSTIITHHNTFRLFNNMKGIEEAPSGFIKEDMFFVDTEMVYMYKNPGSEWTAMHPFIFVRPVDKKHDFLLLPGEKEPLHGDIVYGSVDLNSGDRIVFTPHSEYEFRINGEVLYRMKTSDVCLKLNSES